MTPIEYAALCAKRYSVVETVIKGRGHAPRVRIDWHNAFFKLLPAVKIVDQRHGPKDYSVHWYTTPEIERRYLNDLHAAGIDPQRDLDDEFRNIFSKRFWKAACVSLRLSGTVYSFDVAEQLAVRARSALERRVQRLAEHSADRETRDAVLNGSL